MEILYLEKFLHLSELDFSIELASSNNLLFLFFLVFQFFGRKINLIFTEIKHFNYGFCSFTDNTGLCGIPGLPTCRPHLSIGAKIGIAFATAAALFLIIICAICCWKRNQNIARVQKMTASK